MTTTPEETHNTEVEDVADELLWSLTPKSNCGCGGYLDYDDSRTKILETLHHQLQKAREEAVKPYQDGIRQIAKELRATGFKKTADIIERDLATLDHSELDQEVSK